MTSTPSCGMRTFTTAKVITKAHDDALNQGSKRSGMVSHSMASYIKLLDDITSVISSLDIYYILNCPHY